MGSEIQYHFLGPPSSMQIVENKSNSQRQTNVSRRLLPEVVRVLFPQGWDIFLLCPITPWAPLVNPIWWLVVNGGGVANLLEIQDKELNLYFSGGAKYKGRASNALLVLKKFRSEGEVFAM